MAGKDLSWHHKSLVRLGISLLVGVLVGVALALFWRPEAAFVAGWAATALVFNAWVWFAIRKLDAAETRELSQTDDPGRKISRAVLIVATLASLVGVGVLLASGQQQGASSVIELVLGVLSIVLSWTLVHMLYTVRYAELYYGEGNEGIDFPGDQSPDYRDFAYFSYCLGMTYQTSDCDIKDRLIRRTVTAHTLLSYLLGAVVVASTVNLVVQVASQG